jgi:hypothetical protein
LDLRLAAQEPIEGASVGAPQDEEAGMRRQLGAVVSSRSREQKIRWLTERIPAGSEILLVGVSADAGLIGTANAVEVGLMRHARTTALIYDDGRPDLPCTVVRGSALSLPFADGSFDYVVSNAVIEHVGGPAQANSMISESRRVARRGVFHTTPWRWAPVEVHTQLPLLHWLPRRVWPRVFDVAGERTMIEDCWLFGRRELRAMGATVHQLNGLTLIGEWTTTAAQPRRPRSRTEQSAVL